jgi:hygromycin-B 7''-O-kinase
VRKVDPWLPKIASLEAYRSVYRGAEVWLPALRAICEQHRLDAQQLALAPPGTHVVFRVGQEPYVKLFSPLWPDDFFSERLVLGELSRRADLPIPRLVAQGEVEGWPYIVVTAVEGVPLCKVWGQMCQADRERVVTSCGAFMAALHAMPVEPLMGIGVAWSLFVRQQLEDCIASIRERGLGEAWVRDVTRFVKTLPPLNEPGCRPVLLSADVTDEHVLVSERGGRWLFSGYIDFGDAMLGHPLYEFAAPGCSIVQGSPSLLRAMLLGYGYGGSRLDADLSNQLMAYTMIHRYIDIADLVKLFDPRPPDLATLKRRLWPLDDRCSI